MDVDLKEVLDGVLPESFLVTVFLETGSDETKLGWSVRSRSAQFIDVNHLGTPIPKVVHRSDVPSVSLVEVREVGPDNGRSEVPDVEVLGDIW